MMKLLPFALLALVVFPLFAVPVEGAVPDWPSLAEQLRADAVQPRSALAALIAANQDFSLLRPEEAKDKIHIPLWLRVHWRKAHPDMVYSASDPAGGYPLVLKDTHAWMVSHQDLVPGPGEGDSFPAGSATPAGDATTSGEQRISGLQMAPRSESDIRVNYGDPMRIIAASNDILAGGAQAQFYSTNGGASWGQTSLPLILGDSFHSGPAVDWTSDGTAWAATTGVDSSMGLRMRAYKSTDNGATWTFDATFSGAQTAADRPKIWVDHSAASPFKDNVYAIWYNGAPAFMNRRTGPAGSWQTPVQVSGAETVGAAIGGDVKTNAMGDVFGFWPATENHKIFMAKSINGGASYGAPFTIATTLDSFDIGVPAFNSRRALIYVSGGAYRSVARNMVYATWTDLSGEAGCTAPAQEPGSNVASTCKTRIWLARSADGGISWAPPVRINHQASLNDQFNPWMVVDETTGAVGVIYYDTVGDPGRKKTDLWYQSSFNDGLTWSAPLKVTSAQTDETVAGADLGNQYGDSNGLSGIGGVFFPSWTDRRNNAREEIWTAKITDPFCAAPGPLAIGTATATGPNQVQLTWGNGTPASAAFNVYRAFGTCASPGTFTRVAMAVAGSPYNDNAVSGGITYAYRVTGLDATGNCESGPSTCVEVTATGACTLPPSFTGLASATNQGSSSCGITLAWTAAMPSCAGPVTYNVYRSTTSGFTPGPANLLASNVTGTGYSDVSLSLVSGTTYYYVVRAVDSSNGVSETNTVQRGATVTGPVSSLLSETFEGAGGFDNPGWTHSAIAGAVDWAWSTAQSQTPTHSWFSAGQTTVSDRVLVTPAFTPTVGSLLSFWHTFAFEDAGTCFDGGTLEVSTNGGSTWTVLPDAAFTAGGFNGTVSTAHGNAIGGKRAWCHGTIGAMTQVTANLSAFAGQSVKLRWHEGDDSTVAATGWFVDSVTVSGAGACTANVLLNDGFESGNLSAWSGSNP